MEENGDVVIVKVPLDLEDSESMQEAEEQSLSA